MARSDDDDSDKKFNVPVTPEINQAPLRMQNNMRNAPQAKRTLRLESIQEGAM
jgi:hypothetical protein